MKEMLDLGVLGQYPIKYVGCECGIESDDEYYEFIRKFFETYTENIEKINDSIIYEIYDALTACGYPLWEEEEFRKIISEEELPVGFYNMSDEVKNKIFYGFDYTKENLKQKLKENIPFLKIEKLKDDISVTNVVIKLEYKELYIEFFGLCSFFTAMITLKYEDNFEVSEFSPS